MKKNRFTEERIAFALKQAETGTPVAEVLRRMGVSGQTFSFTRPATASATSGAWMRDTNWSSRARIAGQPITDRWFRTVSGR